MLLKIFGMLDILAAFSFYLAYFGVLERLTIVLAVLVILKAIVFFTDISSFMDLVAGFFLVLVFFGVFNVVSVILSIWLLQKGIFSLIA